MSTTGPVVADPGLLEGVESASDVCSAKVSQLRLDVMNVGVELLFDWRTDDVPALFGLFHQRAGVADGPFFGSSSTAGACSGVRIRLGSLELVAGVVELAGSVAFGGVAPAAGAVSELAEVVVQLLKLQLRVVALRRPPDRRPAAAVVESLPHLGNSVLECWFGFESGGDGGGMGDPALVVGDSPVILEVVDGLAEVVGGGVDCGVVSGAAHGDVAEFSAAAGGEDVGPVVGHADKKAGLRPSRRSLV